MATKKNRLMSRDELNQNATDLLEQYGFVDSEDKPLSANADIFKANLHLMVTKFKDAMSNSNLSEDAVEKAKSNMTEALSFYNDEMRVQRLEQLKTLGYQSAVVAYLGTQKTMGLTAVIKEAEKSVTIKDKSVGIDPPDFYDFMLTCEKDSILDDIVMFTYNVQRRCAYKDNEESKEKGRVEPLRTVKTLSDSYMKKLREKGWDYPVNQLDAKTLAEDLSYIVDRLCFHNPKKGAKKDKKGRDVLNHFIKMYMADFRVIERAVTSTTAAKKGEEDKATVYVTPEEWTVVRAIFRQMFTRYHAKSMGHIDNTNGQNAVRTSAPNKDMAENPKSEEFAPPAPPKAGPVELGAPEK